MTQEVGQLPAATTQVKLCQYDEEELAIWFRLMEVEFATAGIKSQKFHYANTLANLPKQILWDILDTVDLCNDSDQPFDDLKKVLLGQFCKNKWQSYFALLHLLSGMDDLKPSILMGKLKQLLPHGVSPDNDLFCLCFSLDYRPPCGRR
jgi:hypothetical protein